MTTISYLINSIDALLASYILSKFYDVEAFVTNTPHATKDSFDATNKKVIYVGLQPIEDTAEKAKSMLVIDNRTASKSLSLLAIEHVDKMLLLPPSDDEEPETGAPEVDPLAILRDIVAQMDPFETSMLLPNDGPLSEANFFGIYALFQTKGDVNIRDNLDTMLSAYADPLQINDAMKNLISSGISLLAHQLARLITHLTEMRGVSYNDARGLLINITNKNSQRSMLGIYTSIIMKLFSVDFVMYAGLFNDLDIHVCQGSDVMTLLDGIPGLAGTRNTVTFSCTADSDSDDDFEHPLVELGFVMGEAAFGKSSHEHIELIKKRDDIVRFGVNLRAILSASLKAKVAREVVVTKTTAVEDRRTGRITFEKRQEVGNVKKQLEVKRAAEEAAIINKCMAVRRDVERRNAERENDDDPIGNVFFAVFECLAGERTSFLTPIEAKQPAAVEEEAKQPVEDEKDPVIANVHERRVHTIALGEVRTDGRKTRLFESKIGGFISSRNFLGKTKEEVVKAIEAWVNTVISPSANDFTEFVNLALFHVQSYSSSYRGEHTEFTGCIVDKHEIEEASRRALREANSEGQTGVTAESVSDI